MVNAYINQLARCSERMLSWLHILVSNKTIAAWFPTCFVIDDSPFLNFSMLTKCLNNKNRKDPSMNVQHNTTRLHGHIIYTYIYILLSNWVSLSQYDMQLWDKHDMQSTTSNALTARKVSEEVFQANPRTKSFRWTGSALATPLISSAIEGYWEPLYAPQHATKHHMHRVNHTATQFS